MLPRITRSPALPLLLIASVLAACQSEDGLDDLPDDALEPRIADGYGTDVEDPGAYPWQGHMNCNFTLIGPRTVVTAAHCGSALDMRTIEWGLDIDDPDVTAEVVANYDNPAGLLDGQTDVAVMTLEEPIFSRGFARLWRSPDAPDGGDWSGVPVTLVSHGNDSDGRQQTVDMVIDQLDGRRFEVLGSTPTKGGDSGAPWLVDHGGRSYVVAPLAGGHSTITLADSVSTGVNGTFMADFPPMPQWSQQDWPAGGADPNRSCTAVTSSSSPHTWGRWQAAVCSEIRPLACRTPAGAWSLTGAVPWSAGATMCPSGSTFAAPQNGADQDALLAVMDDAGVPEVWIDWARVAGWQFTTQLFAAESWGQSFRRYEVVHLGDYMDREPLWNVARDADGNEAFYQQSNVYETATHEGGTLLVHSEEVGVGTLEVFIDGPDNDGAGLVFGYAGPDDFYVASIDEQKDLVRLARRVGGTYEVLDERNDASFIDLSVGHQLRVEVRIDGTLAVLVDGQPQLAAEVDPPVAGRFGMFSWANEGIHFSELKFAELPADAPVQVDARFGNAVATGDFNLDGHADLVTGSPGSAAGGPWESGAVTVAYGSPDGLQRGTSSAIHQDSPHVFGASEQGDFFGDALAVGDLDCDGFDDIAVGVPGEDIVGNSIQDAGAVQILFGSAKGIQTEGSMLLTMNDVADAQAAPEDHFGRALAIGDFDADECADLAVGAPGIFSGGSVAIFYDLSSSGELWHQDVPGIGGGVESGDQFGFSLAAYNVEGDAADELIVGVPTEDVGYTGDAGIVQILMGQANVGLVAEGDLLLTGGDPQGGAMYGYAVAAADFGDGFEIAVGSPGRTVDGAIEVGAVNTVAIADDPTYGPWLQGSAPGEAFGSALAAGHVWHGDYADLAVGDPEANAGAGHVVIFAGGGSGLATDNVRTWDQDEKLPGKVEPGDGFGAALAIGDFDGNQLDDVAVGVPTEDVSGQVDAGAVNIIFRSGTKLRYNSYAPLQGASPQLLTH